MPRIITLDGPAGVGKSTLAKRLAEELRIPFLDTGAMFRIAAFNLGENALGLPEGELSARLDCLEFTLEGSGNNSVLRCNGKVCGQEIRSEEIGLLSSRFAALPAVRSFLKKSQQSLGRRFDLVAEGRDMGTEVFTFATRKFFLDASPRVRALRRMLQLEQQGVRENLEKLEAQIIERDNMDRNRAVAPLRPAEDAIVIDTSNLDENAVFALLLKHVRNGTPA